MAPIQFPNLTPDNITFGITYNTQVHASDISGILQTIELPGARWSGSMTFTDLTPADSATLRAFLLQLRGSSGSFYFGDLSQTQPQTTVTGAPTIETGSTRRIVRTTTSSGSFSVGDYIQLDIGQSQELKMVVAVSAVGGNTYDYTIEPMIRMETFIGQEVVYSAPKGVFMLNSDDQANWAVRSKALLSDITLDFIERF